MTKDQTKQFNKLLDQKCNSVKKNNLMKSWKPYLISILNPTYNELEYWMGVRNALDIDLYTFDILINKKLQEMEE